MHTFNPLADENRRTAFREWNKRRLANIHAHVTAADVLSRHGVTLQRGGQQPEQISCPFHGNDSRPSAKYFPGEGDSLSGVWCFVCHQRWDAIGLWKKFNATGAEKFGELLRQLERAFGLTPPEANGIPEPEAAYDPLVDEVRQLFLVAERRLKEYRHCFLLEQHLKIGQLLDHTQFYLDHKHISLEQAKERLVALNAKIKKVRVPRATPPSNL